MEISMEKAGLQLAFVTEMQMVISLAFEKEFYQVYRLFNFSVPPGG